MSHVNSPSQQAASTLLTRSVDCLIRWRLLLLGLALLLTVVAWPISQKLAFDQSIESLYAEADPHLRDFLHSRQLFGGDEFVIVAYSEPEIFVPESNSLTEAATQRGQAFADELDEIPGIMMESTQHLARAFKFPYRLDAVRKIVVGVLVGEDEHTTAIVLRLMPEKESPIPRGETIARIRQLAEAHDPPAMVAGEPVQIHDMFRYVEEDGRKLFVVSLGLLALVLLLLLQQLRWVVLPLIVVIVSITWTEAILVLSRMRLSMVSSMLNSLITIISVQTAMHVSLYFRDQHRTLSPIEALRRSMVELAGPVWWTVVTTAFGFGVLVTSHINPVVSFGVMMAIGSMVVLVAVTMLLPGCVLLGRMPEEPPPSAADRRVAAALGRITLWVEHHPRWVTGVSLAIVAFAGAGFSRLRVETDFSKNFRERSPIVQSLQFVESQLGGAGSWEVNFPAPEKPTTEFIDRVREFAARLRTEFGLSAERPTETAGRLSKVLAITDGLDLIPERILFSLSLETRMTMLGRVQSDFVNSLYNPANRRMRIMLRAYERQPSETKLKLIEDIERLAQQEFGQDSEPQQLVLAEAAPNVFSHSTVPKSTGLFVLLAFLIESLMDDQWTSFFISTIGITSMMWYAFRRLPIGLMSLVPNLFPNILVIGLMGWIGLPINIATAMIACVSMGLTVDSSIIYIDGYQRARARGLRVYEALHETHRDVGRALVYSNIALMSGFSVLALSHFIPLIYFGLLVSLAMFGGLIGNLVFLPLLIGWWDGRKEAAEESLKLIDQTTMAAQIGVDVDHAARLLREGKLVAFATETVYGLGANALDVAAVARVFAVKNRPYFDPLIVHIADRAWLPRLVSVWPEKAELLSQRFWPGPLTLVVPKTDLVPDLVTSGLPSVAVRMPAHPLALELLRQADVPIAGPSANPFGQLSPTCAEHVAERLGDQIDYILDGGACVVGVESTVVLLDGDRAILLRPGGVPLEEIEAVIGPVSVPTRTSTHPDEAAPSPGMLPQHYAPRTPLTIVDDLAQINSSERIGLLIFRPEPGTDRFAAVEVLSRTGDLTEAAANFFAALRRLDATGVSHIVARAFPNHGLGRALNDRLTRAASKP